VIGLIDIGGTKLLTAVATADGGVGATVRRATPSGGDLVGALAEMLDEVRGGQPLTVIGASVPGPFDRDRGQLINPPGLSGGWHRLELGAPLGERFGCPVIVENDANCAALAEARLGAGRGAHLCVYFTVSTGIGTGVVREGELVIERHDTEGGHQVVWPERAGGPECECGGAGCLEAIASGRAIARRFGRPAEQIDDPSVWAEVGEWLGLGVVNAVALLDCDTVVFGGGVADARWGLLEPAITATIARHLKLQPSPAIRLGELGEVRNLAGALLLAGRPPGDG
jgi:glucokinase